MDMEAQTSNFDITADTAKLRRALREYRKPRLARSVLELSITAIPFAACWVLLWLSVSMGYWIGLLLLMPAAAFLVRLLMIQHDLIDGVRTEFQ